MYTHVVDGDVLKAEVTTVDVIVVGYCTSITYSGELLALPDRERIDKDGEPYCDGETMLAEPRKKHAGLVGSEDHARSADDLCIEYVKGKKTGTEYSGNAAGGDVIEHSNALN